MVNSSSEILPYEISWCNDDANYLSSKLLLQFLNHHQTAQFFREMLQVINHIHITIHFLNKSEAKKNYIGYFQVIRGWVSALLLL